MQLITKEFNFSETVFVDHSEQDCPHIRIFTPSEEMEFAGHPVIGTGHVLFRQMLPGLPPFDKSASIQTKAGRVVLRYDSASNLVSAHVPHNVHIHSKETPEEIVLATQPALAALKPARTGKGAHPAVSIVKGATYVLVDYTEQPDLFAALRPGPSPSIPLDPEWEPSHVGIMYYKDLGWQDQGKTRKLQVRMIASGIEDPATGGASCALGAFLALQHGTPNGSYRFSINQGHEMGRASNIVVDVTLNDEGNRVAAVSLSGNAAPVTEGKILLPV